MFTKLIIGLTAFLAVAGTAGAMEWQPSWAPVPLELVPGQTYRTGSPLSRPGLLGLFGGIVNGVTGGTIGAEYLTGGGTITWEGPSTAPATVTINGVKLRTLTPAEAKAAQEAAPVATENKSRLGDDKRADCGYSFAKAVQMDTAYDWCSATSIEYAALPQCPAGQALWTTLVEDDELGARPVYDCRGE